MYSESFRPFMSFLGFSLFFNVEFCISSQAFSISDKLHKFFLAELGSLLSLSTLASFVAFERSSGSSMAMPASPAEHA